MTEKLTMEHLESLLETMEPAQIREQYSADWSKTPNANSFSKPLKRWTRT